MANSLYIIIVNWNSGNQLKDCISSVGHARQDGFNLSNVVIVDNASMDDSLHGVEQLGVPVTIIPNKENRGFAAACNQGAAEAPGEYLLFLNPDMRLFEDSLTVPLVFMQRPENADVGIVGIQLVDENNHIARSSARFPSLSIFIAQALGLNRLPGLRHLNTHMSEWAHDKTATVDHVIGAFYLIRRPLFESLGGFDERFFVYLEDLDLSLRAHQAGWRSVYLTDAQAFHAGGGTSRQVKAHRLFYSLRSRLLYGFKHFTPWQARMLLCVTVLLEPVSRSMFSLLRGGMQDVRNTWGGYSMLYRDLPNIVCRSQTNSMLEKTLEKNMSVFESIQGLLICPRCHGAELNLEDESSKLKCDSCGAQYLVIHGRPVLLRPDNDVFCLEDYRRAAPPSPKVSVGGIARFIPNPSVNLASERVLARVRQLLAERPSAMVIVVGGGRQRQWLDERLGAGDTVRVVYSDIDVGADVDLFCDGHDLPFANGVFDAVVTTAVLEHVLYPERVAAEIHRVLRVGGLLYSELPFMQQVHEGAYDFTRYTLSGHRRLFNGFAEIESGMVAGPGTALVWAIENFVLAFMARPVLRKASKGLVRFGFAWLKYFDHLLVHRPEAMDGASCTYFLGRKIDGQIPDTEIIARYAGAKHLRHT